MDTGVNMDFGSRVDLAADRLKLWANTFNMLAEGDLPAKLVTVLDEGDLKGLEEILAPARVLQVGGCIDVVSTILKVINFGKGHFEEQCQLAPPILITTFNKNDGEYHRLPNNQFAFVSYADWEAYRERAAQDTAWCEANKEFLEAIGVLRCSFQYVSDAEAVSITRTQHMCFPTVVWPSPIE